LHPGFVHLLPRNAVNFAEMKACRGKLPHPGLPSRDPAGNARSARGFHFLGISTLDLLTRTATRRLPDYLPGVLLITAMWACLAIWISWDRTTELTTARAQAVTLTETLAAQTRQVLGEAERLSALLARDMRRDMHDGGAPDLSALSELNLTTGNVISEIAVTDAQGVVRAATHTDLVGKSLASRDAVSVQLDPAHRTKGLYVGKPDTDDTDEAPAVHLATAVNNDDGSFLGVASLTVDPTYFVNLYKLLRIGQQGMVTIIGTDDYVIRTRRTMPTPSVRDGGMPPGSALRVALASTSQGTFRGTSPIDGVDRMSSYQVLAPYPLVVVVGYAMDEYLSALRHRRELLILAGLFMTGLIIFSELRRVALWRRLADSALRERRAMEQQAEKAARLKALFKAIPEVAVAFSDGVVDNFNPRPGLVLDQIDPDSGDWTPERVAELFFADDLSEDRDLKQRDLARALAGEDMGGGRLRVYTLNTPRIAVFEIRIESLPAPYAGTVALVRDITAQTQVDRMKSEFVSTAAHELRTPTAGILGLSELLEADRVPEARKHSLYTMIRNQAQALSDLVADLLDLARIEARADKDFNMTHFMVTEAVERAIDRLPGVRDRLVSDGSYARTMIHGDAQQIESAVRNLLENCVKYSAPDTPITVGVHDVDSMVEIRVADRGIGISVDNQARVFDKFFRVDKNGAIPGTGLGLAMVQEIVVLHGGSIRLESQPKVGTTVIISLPALA